MCGIWAVIGRRATSSEAEQATKALHARGPEGSATLHVDNSTLGFTRLAINGLTESGMQPMHHQGISWVCNGEIYNWKELAQRLHLEHTSESDCSILGALWAKHRQDPTTFFRALDGVFALIIVDQVTGLTTVARDPYGVRPLFYVEVGETLWFASEMKALMPFAAHSTIQHVRPGTFMQLNTNEGGEPLVTTYHTVPWLKNPALADPDQAARALKDSLTLAVKKRLLTERPIAALLSGGIDSSLIAALVQKELKEKGKTLETYTIGFEGSTDLQFAREVAAHIGSDHTELLFTPQQFFDAIPEVIRSIESYDITTVRASVGNWLVSREIAKLSEAKVLFNGDGSDEVFGSYLYFFRAPDHESYEAEVTRLLEDIHKYDVLRSDRSISSHGLEPRTPFLDKQFVALARSIPTQLLRPIPGQQVEKALLRRAFDDGLLPLSVLHRQKEAFSDGVSSQTKPWYQEIQERVDVIEALPRVYTHLCPHTPEAQYYRDLFDAIYGDEGAYTLNYFWMPKWSGETKDPSARTLSFYTANQ